MWALTSLNQFRANNRLYFSFCVCCVHDPLSLFVLIGNDDSFPWKWMSCWYVLFIFQKSYSIMATAGIRIKSSPSWVAPVHASRFKFTLAVTHRVESSHVDLLSVFPRNKASLRNIEQMVGESQFVFWGKITTQSFHNLKELRDAS